MRERISEEEKTNKNAITYNSNVIKGIYHFDAHLNVAAGMTANDERKMACA